VLAPLEQAQASPQPAAQDAVAVAIQEESRPAREETPEAAAQRIQLVLRIGHLTPEAQVTSDAECGFIRRCQNIQMPAAVCSPPGGVIGPCTATV
jgi:hypothetical protein